MWKYIFIHTYIVYVKQSPMFVPLLIRCKIAALICRNIWVYVCVCVLAEERDTVSLDHWQCIGMKDQYTQIIKST